MTRKKAILTIIISALGIIIGYFTLNRYRNKKKEQRSLNSYKDLIDEISETIIPRTNTPGAKDAGVSKFIIDVIENCASSHDKSTFLNGLIDLEKYCQDNFAATFSNCGKKNKVLVLKHFESKDVFSNYILNKIRRKIWGQSFFEQMKSLTISGYCTSMLGATRGLAYDNIPGEYISCTPYSSNQKSWATK